VTVEYASNIAAMDSNGYSDPYVKVKFGHKPAVMTQTLDKTLDPEWCEMFPFECESLDDHLTLSVFDYDMMQDDFIGEVRLGSLWKVFVDHGLHDLTADGASDTLQITESLVGRLGHADQHVTGTLTFSIQLVPDDEAPEYSEESSEEEEPTKEEELRGPVPRSDLRWQLGETAWEADPLGSWRSPRHADDDSSVSSASSVSSVDDYGSEDDWDEDERQRDILASMNNFDGLLGSDYQRDMDDDTESILTVDSDVAVQESFLWV